MLGDDPLAETYGGTSVLSEIEAQCVENTLQANKAAVLFIDFHNYFIPATVLQDDSVFGYVDGGSYWSRTSATNADTNGILSTTLEVGETFQGGSMATRSGAVTQTRDEEIILIFLLQHIKHLSM